MRIARFQNCYGPLGTWAGGREKAPAALCRKVAEAREGGEVEVWGNGSAVRSYTYVADMVEGIFTLMQSDMEGAANIGSPEYVNVQELFEAVVKASGKSVTAKYVEGRWGLSPATSATPGSSRSAGRRRPHLSRESPRLTPGSPSRSGRPLGRG